MGDTFIIVIAIFLATLLLFIFPLMSVTERNDDISQLAVQNLIVEFVDNAKVTGKITNNEYSNFLTKLAATGNTYDVELERKVLDENPGKKVAWTSGQKIGENIYYSVYTSQIEEALAKSNIYTFNEGDIFSVKVKNTNQTISQLLRNFFYRISDNSSSQIAASHSSMITTTGVI